MEARSFSASVEALGPLGILAILLGGAVLSTAYLAFNRLFLSPVAKVPGPRLAAVTFWYEYYYDVYKKGTYSFKIKELHKQYGPVIRINPYEVHIDDPDFYDRVYVSAATRTTEKWSWSSEMFGITNSTISTIPHMLHRHRRAMFANYLSTTSVHKLDTVIREKIGKLMRRLEKAAQTKEAVSFTHAYSALTMDIITTYCFGKSSNALDIPEFAREYDLIVAQTSLASHFNKQFPQLVRMLKKLPRSLIKMMNQDQALIYDMGVGYGNQVQEVIDRRAEENRLGEKKAIETSAIEKTIFDAMLDAKVPESEKSHARLTEDAQLLVIAGTLTTAHTLMTISYHLLANPAVLSKLREELADAEAKGDESITPGSTPIPLQTLESLPYLTAVIREGLRVGYGVPHRLQRVFPNDSLDCHGYNLPPGTPISMSAMLMHDNETLFPDHERFNPDRWLPLNTTGARLNKYLIPFSKGSRNCAGMNLAWTELYLTIATVFGTQARNMTMYDTVFERDVKTTIDGFNPLIQLGSKGLQVMIDN